MFNEILRQAMQEKEITQTALSAATGISKSGISQYLSGKNEPSDKRKEKIAVALGLSPDYFKKVEVTDSISADAPNLPVITAARLMGKSKEFIYQGLRDGGVPLGLWREDGNELELLHFPGDVHQIHRAANKLKG